MAGTKYAALSLLLLLHCITSLNMMVVEGLKVDVKVNDPSTEDSPLLSDEPEIEVIIEPAPAVESTDADSSANKGPTVSVKDHLDSMTVSQLSDICRQRGLGFDDNRSAWTHADYVEAARKCITIEDEVNSVLAEHPELAAEIEAEVVRMQRMKEELEAEREILLAEKELLERKLKEAGVKLGGSSLIKQGTEIALAGDQLNLREVLVGLKSKDPAKMTSLEVFVLSLVLLTDRVSRDVMFVWKYILSPVISPARKVVAYTYTTHIQKYVDTSLKVAVEFAQPVVQPALPYIKMIRGKLMQLKQKFIRALSTGNNV